MKLNFSRSGTSVSLGGRGLHYTIGPKGTRITAGIPGTGLSWTQYSAHSKSRSRVPETPLLLPGYNRTPPSDQVKLEPIQNATAGEINLLSTSQLVPVLNSAGRKIRIAPFVGVASLLLFAGAFLQVNQVWLGLSALYATVLVPTAIFLDRYRRSVKVLYDSNGLVARVSESLAIAFTELAACKVVWTVQAEGRITDWKRNAGATGQTQRKRTKLQFGKPACLRGSARFPAFKMGPDELYLLPDAALVNVRGALAAISYGDLDFSSGMIKFIEEERVPSDATVAEHTWRYVNKAGGPDRRFISNAQLPVCIYGELCFRSDGGLNSKFHLSNYAAANSLSKVIVSLSRSTIELPRSISNIDTAKRWPTIAFLACAIMFGLAQLSFLENGLLPKPQYVTFNLPSTNPTISTPVKPANEEATGPRASAKLSQPTQSLGDPLDLRPPPPPASDDRTTMADQTLAQQPLDLSQVENLRWVQLRLQQLGFLKDGSPGWNAASRSALRDFKATNNIGNDDKWDYATEEALASGTALRAEQTFVGSWSESACEPGSRPHIVINARRATSAAGGICEFSSLKQVGASWSIATTCSNAGEKWSANIRLAVTGDELTWIGRDGTATQYSRCR